MKLGHQFSLSPPIPEEDLRGQAEWDRNLWVRYPFYHPTNNVKAPYEMRVTDDKQEKLSPGWDQPIFPLNLQTIIIGLVLSIEREKCASKRHVSN